MIRIPEKIEQWTELAFKALFFLYVGLGSCSLTYGRSVISWVMYAAFLLGGAVLQYLGSLPLLAICTAGFTVTALALLFNGQAREI